MTWSSYDTQFVKLAVTFVLLTLALQQFNDSQSKQAHIAELNLDYAVEATLRGLQISTRLGHACGTLMNYAEHCCDCSSTVNVVCHIILCQNHSAS